MTGLSMSVNTPSGRKIKLSFTGWPVGTVTGDEIDYTFKESSTVLQRGSIPLTASKNIKYHDEIIFTPSAGVHTYKMTVTRLSGAGTVTAGASSTRIAHFTVELV